VVPAEVEGEDEEKNSGGTHCNPPGFSLVTPRVSQIESAGSGGDCASMPGLKLNLVACTCRTAIVGTHRDATHAERESLMADRSHGVCPRRFSCG
jgi:hypothetical protein